MTRIFDLVADLSTENQKNPDLRADKYLHELFSEYEDLDHLSRSQIQKLIEAEAILVDLKPLRSKDGIAVGSAIRVALPEPTALEEVIAENIPLHILYEDEHLIVINKQPGLTVHPSDTQSSGTLVNALLYHVKDLSGIGGKLRPGIVHRIDKETSGVMVITKHDEAHLGLSKLFSTHTITRKYWALAYGAPHFHVKPGEKFRIETTIGRNPADRKKMAINQNESQGGGRRAVSYFKVLEEYLVPGKTAFGSMIEATLETGRTHQVRVHLTHLGSSIMGDLVYGVPSSNQPKWKAMPHPVQHAIEYLTGQALHARVLGFKHPITGKDLYFEAEPFEAFQNLLNELRKFGGPAP